MATELQRLVELGKEMGYEGPELQQFVRQQQEAERQQRIEEREAKKAEAEAKKAEAEADAQRRREEQERQRQIEQEREEREAQRRREDAEREREFQLKTLELQLQADQAKREAGVVNGQPVTRCPLPKLQPFDEAHDEMDAFLERFERFAKAQKWPEETWGSCLSPLLKGKALRAYTSLPVADGDDYEKLREALLRAYELNEEGFRKKFRESKPKQGESATQFISRISIYFTKWRELSKVKKDYACLENMILGEQFLSMCSEDLACYLKERKSDFKSSVEMAHAAERYLDAHSRSMCAKQRQEDTSGISDKPNMFNSQNSYKSGQTEHVNRGPLKCFLCNKTGHLARDCRTIQESRPQKAASAQVFSRGFISNQKDPGSNYDKDQEKSSVAGHTDVTDLKEFLSMADELVLANGEVVPIVSGSCIPHEKLSLSDSLPVADGYVGKIPIKVLRDSGCTSAAVREDLVQPGQMTGKVHVCKLFDNTLRVFRIAKVEVNTPFYTGEIEAMVVKEPIYDLIIGNIPGAKDPQVNQARSNTEVKLKAQGHHKGGGSEQQINHWRVFKGAKRKKYKTTKGSDNVGADYLSPM